MSVLSVVVCLLGLAGAVTCTVGTMAEGFDPQRNQTRVLRWLAAAIPAWIFWAAYCDAITSLGWWVLP